MLYHLMTRISTPPPPPPILILLPPKNIPNHTVFNTTSSYFITSRSKLKKYGSAMKISDVYQEKDRICIYRGDFLFDKREILLKILYRLFATREHYSYIWQLKIL